MSKITNDGLTQ